MKVTRDIFPNTDIRIVSNGLLFDRVTDEQLQAMHDLYAGFDFSDYPPTHELKAAIGARCRKHKVDHQFTPLIKEFFANHQYNAPEKMQYNYEHCGSKHCHFLGNGKFAICGMPILAEKFPEIADQLGYKALPEDIIDLYDPNIDGFKINEMIHKPVASCAYCNDPVSFPWQGHYTKLYKPE